MPGESRVESDGGQQDGRPPERYRVVFEMAPDGILLVDGEGTIVEANREAARLFGYEPGELVGELIERLVPSTDRDAHRRHRRAYGHSPQSRPMGLGLELVGVRKDGVRVPLEISLSPLPSESRLFVIAVVRDLTDRRRLREFGTGALQAAEDERGRIARELHDDTAQTLAGLLVRMRVMEQRATDHETRTGLAALRGELRGAVEGIRRIARGLRPPELDGVGLGVALQTYVREHVPTVELRLELGTLGEKLPPERGLAVYRIFQEALSNAVRHSGASQVVVRATAGDEDLTLEVSDDGRGFDPRIARDPGSGLGLIGMQERTHLAGGSLEIESAPGRGTRVRLKVPFRPPSESTHG